MCSEGKEYGLMRASCWTRSQKKFPSEVDACHVIKNMSRTQIRKKVEMHSRKRVWGSMGSFRPGKKASGQSSESN